MKYFAWILLVILLIGCANSTPVPFGEPISDRILLNRESEPAPADSAFMVRRNNIKQQLPFVDFASWKIVNEVPTGDFSKVVKKIHPFNNIFTGIGVVKNGTMWETYIKTPDGCLSGPLQVIKGHPIFIYEVTTTCMLYDNLDSVFFNE